MNNPHYRTSRPMSGRNPGFRGTPDLKFSVAEQVAIRDAEAAFGYQPQHIPQPRRRSAGLAWLLGGAFAIWLALNLLVGFGRLFEHGLPSAASVQTTRRPRSTRFTSIASRNVPVQNPRPLLQRAESGQTDSGVRPEQPPVVVMDVGGRRIYTNAVDPPSAGIGGAPQFSTDTSSGTAGVPRMARTSDPACPEGQPRAEVGFTITADDHVVPVVRCKIESSRGMAQEAFQTATAGPASAPPSVQQPSEAAEPRPLDSKMAPSSATVTQGWQSFRPEQRTPKPSSAPFQAAASFSCWPVRRRARKHSFLRRALGGVGRALEGVAQVAATPLQGWAQTVEFPPQTFPYHAPPGAERRFP